MLASEMRWKSPLFFGASVKMGWVGEGTQPPDELLEDVASTSSCQTIFSNLLLSK